MPPVLRTFTWGISKNIFIYTNHPWSDNIIFYKRYIDDLIFIWKGSDECFKDFTGYLNDNEWGLTFSGDISPTHIHFLDITLFNEKERILTKKTFLKKWTATAWLILKAVNSRSDWWTFPLVSLGILDAIELKILTFKQKAKFEKGGLKRHNTNLKSLKELSWGPKT